VGRDCTHLVSPASDIPNPDLSSPLTSLTAHVLLAERTGTSAIIHLSARSVRFLVKSDNDTALLYSSLRTDAIFAEFRCESRVENIITLEVKVGNLVEGLRPAVGAAESLTIKLTKRDGAQLLRVHMTLPDGGVEVVQTIPVRVVGAAEMVR
jgi:hypothetical protein